MTGPPRRGGGQRPTPSCGWKHDEMTRRMAVAVADPHVDVLGHCTRPVVVGRPTGVELTRADLHRMLEVRLRVVTLRPERLDPPKRLLRIALEIGCLVSIDTDATPPASWNGGLRLRTAADCGVAADRVINTRSAEDLLAWTAHRGGSDTAASTAVTSRFAVVHGRCDRSSSSAPSSSRCWSRPWRSTASSGCDGVLPRPPNRPPTTSSTRPTSAPPFRAGLTTAAASKSIPDSHQLLGCPAVALTNQTDLLAWDGVPTATRVQAALPDVLVASGRAKVIPDSTCEVHRPYFVIRSAVIVPIVVGDDVVGHVGRSLRLDTRPGLIRATTEVARWASTQVELAGLEVSGPVWPRPRCGRCGPIARFIFNAMTAIASFVRSEPRAARDLLLGSPTSPATSFRSRRPVHRRSPRSSLDRQAYLVPERARSASVSRSPSRSLPRCCRWRCLLCCSRWWRTPSATASRRSRVRGASRSWPPTPAEARITVEDDGVGMDTELVRSSLRRRNGDMGWPTSTSASAPSSAPTSVGRTPGAGTKVSLGFPSTAAGCGVMTRTATR